MLDIEGLVRWKNGWKAGLSRCLIWQFLDLPPECNPAGYLVDQVVQGLLVEVGGRLCALNGIFLPRLVGCLSEICDCESV